MSAQERRRSAARRRAGATVLSLAGHLLALLVLFSAASDLPRPAPAPPMEVSLVQGLRPAPAPGAAPAAAAAQAQASRPAAAARTSPARAERQPERTPPRPVHPHPLPAAAPEAAAEARQGPADYPTLSAAELAGAAEAGGAGEGEGPGGGSGGGGGACNMGRLVQRALRRDPLVQAAVAPVHPGAGKAIMVWNGDWVMNPGQDGKGLAAVREAIMWEIAFAPEACRNAPVHGLVLLSVNDQPGFARLAVGSGSWRWSDLLGRR